jgi:hypothetical protein
MAKSTGIMEIIFKKLFKSKISNIEYALENDSKIKKLTKKIDKDLKELESAVDDHINNFGG